MYKAVIIIVIFSDRNMHYKRENTYNSRETALYSPVISHADRE